MKYFTLIFLTLIITLTDAPTAWASDNIAMTEHWNKVTTSEFSSTVLGENVRKTVITYAIKPEFTTKSTQSSMILEIIDTNTLSAFNVLTDRFNTLKELLRGFQVTLEPEYISLEGHEAYRAKGKRIVSNLLRDTSIEDQDAKLHYYAFSTEGKVYVIRYLVAREHWKMSIGISESVRSLIKQSTTIS